MFEAFQIGPFIIWTRLVFFLVGLWLATKFFLRLAESAHLSLQHFKSYSLNYLASFLFFGRLFAIIAEYRVYRLEPLRVFIFWDGGFSLLGGAMGIAVVLSFVTRLHRATFLQWLDVLLPATTFALSFDWLGKFAAGTAYGKPTDMFWGVTYNTIGVRYTVPVHPVQLYYAVFFFFLTFLLLVIRKHEKRAGSETLWGLALATVATFVFEYFRGDFGIPVFATKLDFAVLLLLFLSLGVFASVEVTLSAKGALIYTSVLTVALGSYVILRNWLPFVTIELRFSQFLAILSLLAAVVYVVVHRRKYPHL